MAAAPHEWFDGFGDLGTWLGSLGTVAAFAVGFYQIHRERKHRLLREMTDRIRLRRSHADQVSAWITGSELIVANHSGHPIHDVAVRLDGSGPQEPQPGPPPWADGKSMEIGFVIPGERRYSAPHPPEVTLVPALTFTDIRGDRWYRVPGGAPSLVDAVHRGPGTAVDEP